MTSHPSTTRSGQPAPGTAPDRPSVRVRATVAARLAVVLTIVGALLSVSIGAASAASAAGPRTGEAVAAVQAGPRLAMSASCGGGRCTVYLTKAETRALGNGSAPRIPASVPWQLQVAYYGLVYGHVWLAQQYANRGMCSGFRLSIYPWESQGYFGYAC